MACLLARQPIYDRGGKVVACEVFLRKKGGFTAQSVSKEKVSEVLSKGKKVLVKKIESEVLSPPEVLKELDLVSPIFLVILQC